jgi:hypothetical protein
MLTTATHKAHATIPERVLFLAFAWRETTWKRGCTTGPGHPSRERPVTARHRRACPQKSPRPNGAVVCLNPRQ